jgi:hypothetical protein
LTSKELEVHNQAKEDAMPLSVLYPAVEQRLKAYHELSSRAEHLQLHYHAIFNNGKVKNRKIAETIADFVFRKS